MRIVARVDRKGNLINKTCVDSIKSPNVAIVAPMFIRSYLEKTEARKEAQ